MQSAKHFVVFFRWSDKRSFSIFVEDKKLFVRRTAGLSLLSLGWERKEKSKFSDGGATSNPCYNLP